MTVIRSKRGRRASIRRFSLPQQDFSPDVIHHEVSADYIRALSPAVPVSVIRPNALTHRARELTAVFPGRVMYAVKCNPDDLLLKAMHEGGVRTFDVASIGEIRQLRGLFPDAKLYFMHPIKAPEAIREAYTNHGVRAFVLDYAEELDKILRETNNAPDLELFVRIAVPKGNVATDFSTKFGAKPDQAAELVRLCRQHCAKLGVSFHVGTQCTDPVVYKNAVNYAAGVIEQSGVQVEALDVGGGFPATLDQSNPPPAFNVYAATIGAALKDNDLLHLELLCEVGRGLVAGAGALIVRVEGRKDDLLYLNDGTYGGIFEGGGAIGLPYPATLYRREERPDAQDIPLKAFRFAGPTCDSVDMLKGPFMLPADIQVGDWIKLDQLGAYGEVSRTNFNGFGTVQKVIVCEEFCHETTFCEDSIKIA